MKKTLFALLAATLLMAGTSFAQLVSTFDDIRYWAGAGTKEAAFVVNWWNGTSSEGSYAWGYRWEGTSTAYDMFNTIFTSESSIWGWKPVADSPTAVYGIAFDPTYGGLNWTFGHSNPPWPNPDTLGTADSGVLLMEGWNTDGFWSLFDGGVSSSMPTALGSTSGTWSTSFSGLSDITISDGQWLSFAFDPTYAFDGSNIPTSAIAAVPEPISLWLLLVASALFVVLHCKRRPLQR